MHPHNYYLEILTETGLIGFILIFFILQYLYITFIKKYFLNTRLKDNNIMIPFIFIYSRNFPLKSTGSFLQLVMPLTYFLFWNISWDFT